jgi:hypothetical protein
MFLPKIPATNIDIVLIPVAYSPPLSTRPMESGEF